MNNIKKMLFALLTIGSCSNDNENKNNTTNDDDTTSDKVLAIVLHGAEGVGHMKPLDDWLQAEKVDTEVITLASFDNNEWTKSSSDLAAVWRKQVDNAVEKAVKNEQYEKVLLIGHSTGGALVADKLLREKLDNKVKPVLLSPNLKFNQMLGLDQNTSHNRMKLAELSKMAQDKAGQAALFPLLTQQEQANPQQSFQKLLGEFVEDITGNSTAIQTRLNNIAQEQLSPVQQAVNKILSASNKASEHTQALTCFARCMALEILAKKLSEEKKPESKLIGQTALVVLGQKDTSQAGAWDALKTKLSLTWSAHVVNGADHGDIPQMKGNAEKVVQEQLKKLL